jgi:hypothetical protein
MSPATRGEYPMKPNPFELIDSVIDPIPVVGPFWADVLYTVIGLADALNLRHFNGEYAPVPTAENIVRLHAAKEPVALREAA